MKSLVAYFKSLFKPKFQTTLEDLSILEYNRLNKEPFSFEEEEAIPTLEKDKYEYFLTILIDIHNEIEIIEGDSNIHRRIVSMGIDYAESLAYFNLIEEPLRVQISFLFFILDIVNNTPQNTITHFHNQFLSSLFNLILNKELHLLTTDFDRILFFENENWIKEPNSTTRSCKSSVDNCVAYFKIDRSVLIEKAIVDSYKKPLSKKFITYIEEYHPNYVNPFYIQAKDRARILVNNKYLKSELPFFLLEDFFGEKVNKRLLNTNKEKGLLFSEILQLLSKKTETNEEIDYRLDELIQKMELDYFSHTALKIIDFVVKFKPHLRTITKSKDYKKLFDENTNIIYELLKLLDRLSLIQKIPSNNLISIVKRSYYPKEDQIGLANESKIIGNLCIALLAKNYSTLGKVKLEKLQAETKYKRLKKRIDQVL